MLPWFVHFLIEYGFLQTAEQWILLSPAEQRQLEIIIIDVIGGLLF
jgi:hypothetical protein